MYLVQMGHILAVTGYVAPTCNHLQIMFRVKVCWMCASIMLSWGYASRSLEACSSSSLCFGAKRVLVTLVGVW